MAGTPYGSFLVRSSETRAAYALSVKYVASRTLRCSPVLRLGNEVVKHYIIESEPDGKVCVFSSRSLPHIHTRNTLWAKK